MINGKGIQLLASLGYEHFKSLIEFISVLLKNCRNQYKQCKRYQKRNEKLKAKAEKYGNNIKQCKIKVKVSRQRDNRICKQIDKNFTEHGSMIGKSTDEMIDCWINHQQRRKPYIFVQNKQLAAARKREFDKLQQQLWNNFKNDETRIKNLTLNYVNRRHSYRDIQNHREAVE